MPAPRAKIPPPARRALAIPPIAPPPANASTSSSSSSSAAAVVSNGVRRPCSDKPAAVAPEAAKTPSLHESTPRIQVRPRSAFEQGVRPALLMWFLVLRSLCGTRRGACSACGCGRSSLRLRATRTGTPSATGGECPPGSCGISAPPPRPAAQRGMRRHPLPVRSQKYPPLHGLRLLRLLRRSRPRPPWPVHRNHRHLEQELPGLRRAREWEERPTVRCGVAIVVWSTKTALLATLSSRGVLELDRHVSPCPFCPSALTTCPPSQNRNQRLQLPWEPPL